MSHLELRKGPNITPFWKSIGGYTSAVKWKGRWYYVGNTSQALESALDWIKAQGREVTRVNGTPAPVERAWAKKGATTQALIDQMPAWEMRK